MEHHDIQYSSTLPPTHLLGNTGTYYAVMCYTVLESALRIVQVRVQFSLTTYYGLRTTDYTLHTTNYTPRTTHFTVQHSTKYCTASHQVQNSITPSTAQHHTKYSTAQCNQSTHHNCVTLPLRSRLVGFLILSCKPPPLLHCTRTVQYPDIIHVIYEYCPVPTVLYTAVLLHCTILYPQTLQGVQ